MKIYIADIPVNNVSLNEAAEHVKKFLENRTPHFAVAINPEKILKAKRDSKLEEILKRSDLNFVDGIGVIWGARIFYKRRFKGRVAGIDLLTAILKIASRKNYRVYLLGSTEKTIEKAAEIIKRMYSGIRIVGFHNGYFKDEKKIVNDIKESNADILFVGLGSPKQEKFIARNLNQVNVKFAMGVGGSFNVLSGEFKRAPETIQKLGLEWLYRFLLNPKRLPRILSLPKFIILLMHYPEKTKEEINFFGITVSNRSMEETMHIAEQFIISGQFHLIVTLNGEMAAKAFKDKEFFDIIKKSDLVIPDGIGIVWGASINREKIIYRIPGVEFAWELLQTASEKGYTVYLLGAEEHVLEKAIERIKNYFPSLRIAGFHSGYFDENEERHIIEEIRKNKVQILLVGIGSEKQEKWIWQHKDLGIPLCIGVGGTFDVWSGRVKRAPKLIQKMGIEWLYRIIIQPSRIVRIGNIIGFAVKVMARGRRK